MVFFNHPLNPQPLHPFPEHVCRRQPARMQSSLYIHILLSALPHDCLPTLEAGTISDLREIYGAGRRNSAVLSGGYSSGGGPQSALFWRRVRRALAPQASLETRGVPSSGAGPSQNGTCLGGGIGSKIRAGRSTVNYFRFGRTRVCIRQSVCTE